MSKTNNVKTIKRVPKLNKVEKTKVIKGTKWRVDNQPKLSKIRIKKIPKLVIQYTEYRIETIMQCIKGSSV